MYERECLRVVKRETQFGYGYYACICMCIS